MQRNVCSSFFLKHCNLSGKACIVLAVQQKWLRGGGSVQGSHVAVFVSRVAGFAGKQFRETKARCVSVSVCVVVCRGCHQAVPRVLRAAGGERRHRRHLHAHPLLQQERPLHGRHHLLHPDPPQPLQGRASASAARRVGASGAKTATLSLCLC